MYSFVQLKTRNSILALALSITCFAVWPARHGFGVVPAPDGGYANGNTAEGQNALFSRTTGGFNTAVGFLSLGHVFTANITLNVVFLAFAIAGTPELSIARLCCALSALLAGASVGGSVPEPGFGLRALRPIRGAVRGARRCHDGDELVNRGG